MHIISVLAAEKARALQANIYFDHLDGEQLGRVVAGVSLREFKRGETLFFEDDPCAGLHILKAGCVKIHRISPQGRQYIVRLMQEGDTFNEVPTFAGGVNPVNAEAIEISQVWVVDEDCVRKMMQASPEFAQKVINNLGQNLRMLVHTVSEMAFYQVTHRLARLISSLPDDEQNHGGAVRWTQEQMAARLGTVREVVARSLRELERSGAIQTRNRRISIADPGVLEEWTQGPWN